MALAILTVIGLLVFTAFVSVNRASVKVRERAYIDNLTVNIEKCFLSEESEKALSFYLQCSEIKDKTVVYYDGNFCRTENSKNAKYLLTLISDDDEFRVSLENEKKELLYSEEFTK